MLLITSSIFFLDFGTNPKKVNSETDNPDNCKPVTTDEGPGIDVMPILFLIQNCTKL